MQKIKSFRVFFFFVSFLQIWQAALSSLNPNPTDSCPLYLNQAVVAALPSRVSRHNCPSSAHFVSRLIRSCLSGGNNRSIVVSIFFRIFFKFHLFPTLSGKDKTHFKLQKKCSSVKQRCFFLNLVVESSNLVHRVINNFFFLLQMVCERSDVFASSCAIARAFPIFSRRSASIRRTEKKRVTVEFIIVGPDGSPLDAAELEVLLYEVYICSPFLLLYCISAKSSTSTAACFCLTTFLLFSVSPTLLMECDWQLALLTLHAMR